MEMTLALKRRFPEHWVRELLAEVERQGLPHEVDGEGAAMTLRIHAEKEDVPELTAWLSEHGDDEPALIFGPRRHEFDPPRKEISLFPGAGATRPAIAWTPEFTGMEIDLTTLVHEQGSVRVIGAVPRLIPDSGFFGRMGLFRVELAVAEVDAEPSHTSRSDVLPVEYFHHDPTCGLLTIGSALHGELRLRTDSGVTSARISDEPTAVRRWKRYVPA